MAYSEGPSPEQLEVLRGMTPAERYFASCDLYWSLRRHKKAFLRSLHPEWSEAQLEEAVRQAFLHART